MKYLLADQVYNQNLKTMSKGTIYLKQEFKAGVTRYLRLKYADDRYAYDECLARDSKLLDYEEHRADKVTLDAIINDPGTQGCHYLYFHKITGLPLDDEATGL
jgi:hypothetical protein